MPLFLSHVSRLLANAPGLILAFGLLLGVSGRATADPLHARIDQAIEASLGGAAAPPASDAEFVRRVYLDLIGRIPSAGQAREYSADTAADKRSRLIDKLLDSPDFARRMQYVFDVMLMERRSSNSIPATQWQAYLFESFLANKPFDQLAREILGASGDALRPAARFYVDRGGETNLLTRDVGRLFLGMDLQCAQCHDHPLVDDYEQKDYYGIFAYLNRSFVFKDAKKKKSFFAEKGEGEVAFKSVFDSTVDEKRFRPRLPGGKMLTEPSFAKGQEYFVKPAKNVRPFPRFSRRAQLAVAMTDGSNTDFNENITNRLWALVMGRGLVHPVGWRNSDNPASHPELLKELGREFAAMKYDVKAFIRQLVLTRAYQRSSEIPESMDPELAEPQRYAVGQLKPLSAEQFAWSLMSATGVHGAALASEQGRAGADPRLSDIFNLDGKRRNLRDQIVEAAVYARLRGSVGQFAKLYGGAEGEPEGDFQASVHQALFFSNGSQIRSWLSPSGDNLMGRLIKMQDPRQRADELYVSILSREPTEEERLEVVEFLLRQADDPNTGLHEIAWALLGSSEYRLNH